MKIRILDITDTETKKSILFKKSIPWLAGIGIATGQILASSHCTVPEQGRCTSCGSCFVAVGSLLAWVLISRKGKDDFYLDDSK